MTSSLGTLSLDLLQEIFEPLTDNPFFVKDADLRYVAVNRAMLGLCGVRYRSDMIGRTASDMYSPADAARYDLGERSILAGAAIVDRVEEIRARRRPPAWLIFSQQPVKSIDGSIVGVVGVGRLLRRSFRSDRGHDGFAKALRYVRENLDGRLDCRQAAARAGISLSQLERQFRDVLGVTPSLYQQRLRLERALQALQQGLSIAQIAQQCGFADQSSFTRRFRLLTGMTPSQYRLANF